ncbi:putative PHF5-like protein [Plasmodium knowlesi]|uniref:tRNA(Phe) 7-[(3-amino-3-carboxypropyl)-4-demethylwyosine(37)-N(4)]-methyltransferase n=1 Tax=Plasmodium knowlesi TaxID=5850 RepID=A0A1Y3DY24_PLAKN|nr:putative PHF5-like protein [Plasmodium knowlesi]
MENFMRRKKKAEKVVDMEKTLPRYAHIYENCKNEVCNIYLNIYREYKEREGVLGEDVKEMEERIKRVVEEKNINDDGVDKSIKKSIDILISPCIYLINRSPDYFTSSCCSGRVVIFGEVEQVYKNRNFNSGADYNRCSSLLEEANLGGDIMNGKTKGAIEEDAFLSYLKGSYHEACYWDDQSGLTMKGRNSSPEGLKRKHRKNVRIYYSSHMHQNLKEDSKMVKSILTECLGGVNTPPPVGKEGEDEFQVVTTSCNVPSEGKKKLTPGDHPKGEATYMNDEDNRKIAPPKKTRIFFKFEPFIIHVKCVNLVSALRLLKMAQLSGLKQSGLLNFNRDVTVAIRGSMRLEHYVEDALSMEENTIAKLLDVCNEKMDHNLRQLVGFYYCYKESMLGGGTKWHPLQMNKVDPIGKSQCLQCERCAQSAHLCGGSEWGQHLPLPEETVKNDLACSGEGEENGSPPNLTNMEGVENTAITEKRKKKKYINWNKYNIELSDEGHIRTGTSSIGKDSSLQWKLLPNEGDLDKFFVWGHDMFIEEGMIYLFGGFVKGVRSRQLNVFDVERKNLRAYVTPLPALSYHCFFRLDRNYACVFGGRKSPENCTNAAWLYDMRRNMWCTAEWRSTGDKSRGDKEVHGEDASRPCGRYRHACAFVRRYRKKQKEVYLFYLHGGVTEKNEVLNDLWEGKLTVEGNMTMGVTAHIEWERKLRSEKTKQEGEASSPFLKNHTMVYNKRRNVIHIVGGCSSSWAEGAHSSLAREEHRMDHLPTYDMKRDCFFYVRCGNSGHDDQEAFPLNRFSHATCPWGHNDFVLMGGMNMHRTLNDVWLFRMKESKWYRLGAFPFHSMYVRAKVASQGDYLYVVGGGCTVFTFGSFFDLPIVANCRSVLVEKGLETANMVETAKMVETANMVETAETVQVGVENVVGEWEDRQMDNRPDNGVEEETPEMSYLAKWHSYLEQREDGPRISSWRRYHYKGRMISPGKKSQKKLLYLIVKDKTYVKEMKNALERMGVFDKGRKIEVYQGGTKDGNDGNSFLVPVFEKIDTAKNYEQVRRFLSFEKIQLTKEGDIFYIHRNSNRGKERTSLKQCLTKLFYNFVNRLRGYLSEAERKEILRASRKYEVVGGIVIFHHNNLGSILQLYRRCVENIASKYMEVRTGKYAKLRTLVKKYRHRKIISYVDSFWMDLRDTFNQFRGGNTRKVVRMQRRLHLKCIERFLKFSSLARRRTVLRGLSGSSRWGGVSPCGCRKKCHPRRRKKECLFNHPWCCMSYVGRRAVKVDQVAKMKEQLKHIRESEISRKNNPQRNLIKKIAIYEHIEGAKRRNRIHLVLGRNAKTIHIENNVMYKLDLQKCMFCSGNGTEKERMMNIYLDETNMVANKENVVDLFCGVGYFTLPLLKFVGEGKIKEYYACDINGDSLKLLRDAVRLNKIDTTHLKILRQNSFVVTKSAQLVRRCHRVLLGLLPHSVEAWCNAFQLLDGKVGGTLHIHGVGENLFEEQFVSQVNTYDYVKSVKNFSESDIIDFSLTELVRCTLHVTKGPENGEAPSIRQSSPHGGYKLGMRTKAPYRGNNVSANLHFAQFVMLEIFKLALRDYLAHRTNWAISILHVERVKSYAPRLYHYVVDIRCIPGEPREV